MSDTQKTRKPAFQSIGDILLDMGAIDNSTLQSALRLQNRRLGEILVEESLADPVLVAQALRRQAEAAPGPGAAFVKMSMRTLHDLLAELDRLQESVQAAVPAAVAAEEDDAVSTTALRFESLRARLEELLLGQSHLLLKSARGAANEACRTTGNQAEVVWEGENLSFDTGLFSEFVDMVVHLSRNAVAHGIELPEERIAAGKAQQGKVTVSVQCTGGDLILRVCDDGKGIDRQKIYDKAKIKGFVTKPLEEMTDDEIVRLILRPGFSTADNVNTVAGRGIGLDVIESSAIRLKGGFNITWAQGKGSVFEVRVPLTFCKLSVTCARIGDQWLGIRSTEIVDVVSGALEPTEMTKVKTFASLFDGLPEDAGMQPLFLRDTAGRYWTVDEVLPPKAVLVHGVTAQIKRAYRICGTFKFPQTLQNGVFVDLAHLAAKV